MRTCRAAVAAALVLLVATACSSASVTTTSGDNTTPTTATQATPSDSATTLSGQGYSVVLPAGWEDITAQAEQQNTLADIAMAEPIQDRAFRTNFNVVEPNEIDSGVSSDELAKEAARELKRVTKSAVTSLPAPDFDGTPALGQTSSTNASDVDVSLIQYFVVKDGLVYAVTMTFDSSRADQAKSTLGEIVASWTWTP